MAISQVAKANFVDRGPHRRFDASPAVRRSADELAGERRERVADEAIGAVEQRVWRTRSSRPSRTR